MPVLSGRRMTMSWRSAWTTNEFQVILDYRVRDPVSEQ